MTTALSHERRTWLGRTGAWCYDHRRRVLAGWLAGVVAVIALASIVGPRFENIFGGVGQSQQVQAILQQRFPSQAGDDAQVVFRSAAPLTSPAVRSRIAAVLAGLRPLPSVVSVSPLVPAADGRIGFATIEFDAVGTKIPAADVQRVIDKARSYARPGLEVALGGTPISDVVSPSPGPSEGIGISAAIIIMLLAFGSVVAMGLPIITALTGVGVGLWRGRPDQPPADRPELRPGADGHDRARRRHRLRPVRRHPLPPGPRREPVPARRGHPGHVHRRTGRPVRR